MTVQDQTKADEKAENAVEQEKENLLDNDTLRKLHGGEVDFDSLTEEQKLEFHNRFVEGDEEGVPTEEEEQAQAQEKPGDGESPSGVEGSPESTQTTEEGEKQQGKTEEVSPEEQERRRRYKELRDQNNTLSQKLKSMEEKMENLKKMKIEKPPQLDQDEYDENAKRQNQYNNELAQKVNQWVDAEAASIAKAKAELQQETLYSEVHQIQIENPELNTSKPIKALDRAFVNFRNALAPGADENAKSEAVEQFLSNEQVRKAKEAEGVLFPFDKSDWEKYRKVSEIHSFKRNGGDPSWDAAKRGDKYPDLDTAYYAYKKQTGYTPDPIKQAAIDATTKVVEQVAGGQSQTTVLSPDDGKTGGSSDSGMTEAQAEQWLINNPVADTPEKMKILNEIMKKFSPSGPPPANYAV